MPTSVTSHSGPEGSLIISRVESSHAGAYICTVTAADGQHAKRDIQLIVNSMLLYYLILIFHNFLLNNLIFFIRSTRN